MNDISEKTFSEWLSHPCTEAFIQYIKNQIEGRKDIAANGGCLTGGRGFSDIGQNYIAQMNTITVFDNLLEDIQLYSVICPKEDIDENDVEDTQDAG